jgi:hypothetical protein
MLRSIRFATLLGGLALVCLLIAAPVEATHPRPAGATPIRLSLVPAYSPCTAPDRTHGPPLAFPSCNPPAQTSAQATVGTPDANGGAASFNSYFRINPGSVTPGLPDEADIHIYIPLNDVRCLPTGSRCGSPNASGPADYTGEIDFTFTVRLTDHFNATVEGGGTEAATVDDMSFNSTGYRTGQTGVPCAETASMSTGSTCEARTTLNSMIPGAAKEKRAVYEITEAYVSDGGADGEVGTAGDNTVFLRPGIFIP